MARTSRPVRSAFLVLVGVLIGAAALALAGCAVPGAPGTGAPTATGSAVLHALTASPSPSTSSALSPEQRAQADADAILADFAVPPGARRLSAPPASLKPPALRGPYQRSDTPYLVDKGSLWEVPGGPAAVLAWEEQHVPRQFTHTETFHGYYGSSTRVTSSGDVYELPAITDVLNSRELMVEAIDAGGGQTAIRVDAQVAWVPPKPAGAVVPSAAAVVTLSMNYGGNAHGRKPPAPVTVTGPATVGKVVALIDHVPPNPGGTYHCPPGSEATLDLAFRARPGGPVLAGALLQLGVCEWVVLTVGKQDYVLGHLGSGRSTAAQVIKIAGLPWKLPPSR